MASAIALTLFLASLQVSDALNVVAPETALEVAARYHSRHSQWLKQASLSPDEFGPRGQMKMAASQPTVPYRQALLNFQDMQYHGPVTMGGGQQIMAVMDTGSFEMVVFTRGCSTCGNTTSYYDRTLSSSNTRTNLTKTHNYGSGSSTSQLNTETVSIGPLRATRLDFWAVYQANMPVIQSGRFGMIFGIGPPSTPDVWAAQTLTSMEHMYGSAPAASPAGQAMENARRVSNRENASLQFVEVVRNQFFSICLRNQTGAAGVVVWNDVNPAGLSHFTRNTVIGTETWSLMMENFALGHSGFSGGSLTVGCDSPSCSALMDSGTSLIVVTTAMYQQIFQAVTNLRPTCANLHTLPSLQFNLGGNSYYLPPKAYLGRVSSPSSAARANTYHAYVESLRSAQPVACGLQLLLMQSPGTASGSLSQYGPMTILGMPFFRQYYTTFDFGHQPTSQRAIHTAAPTSDCNPDAGGSSTSFEVNADGSVVTPEELVWEPMTVDLDKILVSQQAARFATGEGKL